MTTSTLIATGTNATLWACPLDTIDSEIAHLHAIGHLVRTRESQPLVQDWAWDCDCGVYFYGEMDAMLQVWARVSDFMIEKLADEWDDDLGGEDSPSNFVFVRSSDGSTGLIVGGGYYEETEPKLDKLLKSCVADYGIVSGELGANYSDDHGVFETIFERLDDAFSQGRTSLLSPVEKALWQDLPRHFDTDNLPEQFPNVIAHIPN